MKNTILVLLLLSWCIITLQDTEDLGGQAFSFPEQNRKSYVRLIPLKASKPLDSATVCLRFYTDQQEGSRFTLFSLNATTTTNTYTAFTIFWHVNLKCYGLRMGDKPSTILFYGLQYNLNKWNSLCATWNSSTGMSQMIINELPSVRKGVYGGGSLGANPSIILGQEQGGNGPIIRSNDPFQGHINDVHVWDYVISPSEIQNYMEGRMIRYTPGNYLNWRELDFSINGYVLVEDINTL